MAGFIEGSWSALHVDILNTITECLHYVDQIRFRLVCKSWRSNSNPIKHADKLPWVMAIDENYGRDLDSLSKSLLHVSSRGLFYLYDPSQKKKYTLHNNIFQKRFAFYTSILSGATVHASKHGWLLLSPWMHSSLLFYTPFTNKIIQLPKLPELLAMDGCRNTTGSRNTMGTFSTAPTSPDCLIFLLTVKSEKLCVSTCSPGDKTWRSHWFDGDHGGINSMAFVEGVFYCLFSDEVIASFKVEQGEWKIHPYPFSPTTNDVTIFLLEHHLVESYDNNLYANCTTFDSGDHVFRYDQAEMRWLEVENLGDRILFLGVTSMLLPAVGEASELANTIHRADNMIRFGDFPSVSLSYNFREPQKGLLKTYDWIDQVHYSNKIWIQPLQHT